MLDHPYQIHWPCHYKAEIVTQNQILELKEIKDDTDFTLYFCMFLRSTNFVIALSFTVFNPELGQSIIKMKKRVSSYLEGYTYRFVTQKEKNVRDLDMIDEGTII